MLKVCSYNESLRLRERHIKFDVSALREAAAASLERSKTEVRTLRKLAEGGFNCVFEITMDDGVEVIARIPYPSTQSKGIAIASEAQPLSLYERMAYRLPRFSTIL